MALSEFEIIDRFFSGLDAGPGVVLGVGDDCALLRLEAGEELAVTVDTIVAGVHFPADAGAADVAFKGIAAAVSDLGAMGARPLGFTLALTLSSADENWLAGFREGVADAVAAFEVPLVGGDITRGGVTVSVQVMGAVVAGTALRRSGARPGERLCVSGTLGDAAAALQVLEGSWRPGPAQAQYLMQRYYRPRPRLALGRALRGRATAAIDISDGLLADAGHIATASGVQLLIDSDRVPLSGALSAHPDRRAALDCALRGGDDYELCFSLPTEAPLPADTQVVGRVGAGSGIVLDGRAVNVGHGAGYRHFNVD